MRIIVLWFRFDAYVLGKKIRQESQLPALKNLSNRFLIFTYIVTFSLLLSNIMDLDGVLLLKTIYPLMFLKSSGRIGLDLLIITNYLFLSNGESNEIITN